MTPSSVAKVLTISFLILFLPLSCLKPIMVKLFSRPRANFAKVYMRYSFFHYKNIISVNRSDLGLNHPNTINIIKTLDMTIDWLITRFMARQKRITGLVFAVKGCSVCFWV